MNPEHQVTSALPWARVVVSGMAIGLQALIVLSVGSESTRIAMASGVTPKFLQMLTVASGAAAVAGALTSARSAPIQAVVANRAALAGMTGAAGGTFVALATSPVTLILGATLAGAGLGGTAAIHTRRLFDSIHPATRERAGLALGIAAALAGAHPLLVESANAAGLTWRGYFLAVAAISALCAVVARRAPHPTHDDAAAVTAAARALLEDGPVGDQAYSSRPIGEHIRRLLFIPSTRPWVLIWVVLGATVVATTPVMADRLAQLGHLSPLVAGAVLALAWPAIGVASFVAKRARGGNAFALGGAAAAAGTGLILVSGMPRVVPLAGALFVLGAGAVAYAVIVSTVAALHAVPPRDREVALAGAIGAFFVGSLSAAITADALARRFGSGVAIVVIAALHLPLAMVLRRSAGLLEADTTSALDAVAEDEVIDILRRRGNPPPMLACRGIDFAYGHLQVLFDVSLTVRDGEMLALLGTNGAGKSTLLRCVSGVLLPARGTIRFDGGDITYLDAERRGHLGITQIPGGRAVFGPLTVIENLRVYGYSLGRQRRALDAAIDESLAAFPQLAERRNSPASTLSGGQQQMLALSKAFIQRPRVLLVDELSLGLAPIVVGHLLEMVARINATGCAVVLVEQSVNVALSLVEHAYFMEKGTIRFDGAARELIEQPELLRSVFLEGAGKAMRP